MAAPLEDPQLWGVILSVAVFQAERRISRPTGRRVEIPRARGCAALG